MKFLHLSDLHLGIRIYGYSMLEDQAHILNEILRLVEQEAPDAVLLSGDIYDRTIPPAEAVSLFDDFLCRLAQQRVQVITISGNHDSAERLAFGGRLMDLSGVHLAPAYEGTVTPLTLTDDYGEVRFYPLPFVKPLHVRRYFPDEGVESYTDALRCAVAHMDLDPQGRNVLLTHQFVTGAARSDSEEITVGGTDNVDAAVFADFDYVALGHIHSPQNVGSPAIRYCGTPLKYSFSERDQQKSVTLVELREKGDLTVSTLPLTPLRDLREIRGTYEALTARSAYEGTPVDDYLHVVLTDEEDVPDAISRLRTIYPNILKLDYDNTRTRTCGTVEALDQPEKRDPLELFAEFYENRNGQPMSELQESIVRELVRDIWEANL